MNVKTNDAPMTRHLVDKGFFKAAPLGLVDVGCSWDFDRRWTVFKEQFRGWGFDPLQGEVERLNALGKPNATYHAFWVGYKHYNDLLRSGHARPDRPEITNDPGPRLSVWNATTAAAVARHYDRSGEVRYTDARIDLDDFFPPKERQAVDFLKIDTDGHDYEVLLGAAKVLRDAPVLGVQVESNFHGPLHPHVRVFANIDRILREAGFSLFDLEGQRYSRASLPARFMSDQPGPTTKGQLWWGDLLYFRDAADPEYQKNWTTLAPAKVVKLACCFECYDLADCAAELLLQHRVQLAGLVDLDSCLDLLTISWGVGRLSYAEYVELFRRNPEAFYASAPPLGGLPPTAADAAQHPEGRLLRRLRGLKGSLSGLCRLVKGYL